MDLHWGRGQGPQGLRNEDLRGKAILEKNHKGETVEEGQCKCTSPGLNRAQKISKKKQTYLKEDALDMEEEGGLPEKCPLKGPGENRSGSVCKELEKAPVGGNALGQCDEGIIKKLRQRKDWKG